MTRVDLLIELRIHLDRLLPDSTLWRWLQDCAIGTKPVYSEDDLEALKIYGTALNVLRSRAFAKQQVKEYQLGDHQPDRANRTIEVDAQAV